MKKHMKIKDLKKAIENLNDNMDVVIPGYEKGFEGFPDKHYLVSVAGIIDNYYGESAFTLGMTTKENVTFKDTLAKLDVICVQELYPQQQCQQLVTLRDYKNAGVFKAMPNGFEIYDYELDNPCDGSSLLLTHPLLGCLTYLDCRVIYIAPDPMDCACPAFYIDTKDIRERAGISEEDFIALIIEESTIEGDRSDKFMAVMNGKNPNDIQKLSEDEIERDIRTKG